VTEAAKTVQNITGLHGISQTAVVAAGAISANPADVTIAFVVGGLRADTPRLG